MRREEWTGTDTDIFSIFRYNSSSIRRSQHGAVWRRINSFHWYPTTGSLSRASANPVSALGIPDLCIHPSSSDSTCMCDVAWHCFERAGPFNSFTSHYRHSFEHDFGRVAHASHFDYPRDLQLSVLLCVLASQVLPEEQRHSETTQGPKKGVSSSCLSWGMYKMWRSFSSVVNICFLISSAGYFCSQVISNISEWMKTKGLRVLDQRQRIL